MRVKCSLRVDEVDRSYQIRSCTVICFGSKHEQAHNVQRDIRSVLTSVYHHTKTLCGESVVPNSLMNTANTSIRGGGFWVISSRSKGL
jgi:hypothetical protein